VLYRRSRVVCVVLSHLIMFWLPQKSRWLPRDFVFIHPYMNAFVRVHVMDTQGSQKSNHLSVSLWTIPGSVYTQPTRTVSRPLIHSLTHHT